MLNSLVFLTTNKCPISCRFCGYDCSPNETGRLSTKDMYSLIDQVAHFQTSALVVFTGGEPFLLGKDLVKGVEHASKKGFYTRIVTNAYWAGTYEKAYDKLSELKDHGLGEINYSVDDFHQEFIPIQNIRNANDAAIKLDIPALLALKTIKDSKVTFSYLEEQLGNKLTVFDKKKKNPKNNVVSLGVTVPVGRGSENITDDELTWPSKNENWKEPCTEILNSIVISPDMEYVVCCGVTTKDVPEMIVGDIKREGLIGLIEKADNDLMLNWLALEGPYAIMKFVQSKDPSIKFRDQYINNCHLCRDIFTNKASRQVLTEYHKEKIPEISLKRSIYEHML